MAKQRKIGKIGKNPGRSGRVLRALKAKPEKSDWKKGVAFSNPFKKK